MSGDIGNQNSTKPQKKKNTTRICVISCAGKYYSVNVGYPNKKGYLTPYKGYKYHQEDFRRANRRPRDVKECFNRAHSSPRSCVGRSITVLKAMWRLLKIEPTIGVRKHKKIVIASMEIHNYRTNP